MKLARLAPLLVLALLGCSPSPTTAAQVGDATIPQQSVVDLMEACPAVQDNEVTEAVALTFLVRTELLRQVGARNGIEMSDQQLRDFLKTQEGAVAFIQAQPNCVDILLPEAASLILSEQMPGELAGEHLADVDVQINPRKFGWDSNEAVVIDGSGSISVPAPLG